MNAKKYTLFIEWLLFHDFFKAAKLHLLFHAQKRGGIIHCLLDFFRTLFVFFLACVQIVFQGPLTFISLLNQSFLLSRRVEDAISVIIVFSSKVFVLWIEPSWKSWEEALKLHLTITLEIQVEKSTNLHESPSHVILSSLVFFQNVEQQQQSTFFRRKLISRTWTFPTFSTCHATDEPKNRKILN